VISERIQTRLPYEQLIRSMARDFGDESPDQGTPPFPLPPTSWGVSHKPLSRSDFFRLRRLVKNSSIFFSGVTFFGSRWNRIRL
jgi:hypothetical protein